MNPAHWYRKRPTCGGSFGRGKGEHGLARHLCDEPEVIRLQAEVARLLAEAAKPCPYEPYCPRNPQTSAGKVPPAS